MADVRPHWPRQDRGRIQGRKRPPRSARLKELGGPNRIHNCTDTRFSRSGHIHAVLEARCWFKGVFFSSSQLVDRIRPTADHEVNEMPRKDEMPTEGLTVTQERAGGFVGGIKPVSILFWSPPHIWTFQPPRVSILALRSTWPQRKDQSFVSPMIGTAYICIEVPSYFIQLQKYG